MIHDPIVYIIIILYCIIMVAVGAAVSRLNKNEDDFLRGGAKASWWLVGISMFMSGFSAFTFTGAASAVFNAGWSVMWIYWGNFAGFLLCFLWFAPKFRQMRIMAFPEVLVKRFGNHFGQFYTWILMPTAPIYPAIGLLTLGIFVSTFFGIPMESTLIVMGLIVLTYSMFGGAWATLATDFLQGVIVLPFTVIIAVLCLMKIGGIDGLFGQIEAQNLQDTFTFVKPDGAYANNEYNWVWAVAAFLNIIKAFISLSGAAKFRLVKDGKDARKASLLAAGLFLIGPAIWLIPAAVARLLYADQVLAADIAKPAEAAYAIAAMEVLPTALMGIMIVCMFSATMSSLDTTMNSVVGGWVKVAYPGLMKLLGKKPTTDGKKLLFMSRIITLLYGLAVILLAIKFHRDGRGVFELLMGLMAFLSGTGIPILLGMIIKRVPPWAPYATIVLAIIPAVLGVYSESLFGHAWNFQTKFFANIGVGSFVFISSMFWWRGTNQGYRNRVDAFFKEMHTPVDVKKEIGETAESDCTQLRIIGLFTLIIGGLITALTFLSQTYQERIVCLVLGLTILAIGGVFFFLGQRSYKRLKVALPQQAKPTRP